VVPFEKGASSEVIDQHARQIYTVPKQLKPDVWLQPTQVWEVQADSFSQSKVHTLGRFYIKEGMGLSLRFPRFVRTREDKTFRLPLQFFLDATKDEGAEIGTSVEEILRMYGHVSFKATADE